MAETTINAPLANHDSWPADSLLLNLVDLPFPHDHDALTEREAFCEFRLLASQVEVFVAGEFQLNDGQFGLGFEFAVGPDPVAQVEGLARDLANLTRWTRRPGHSGEFFGFAQLFFIFAESHC